MKTKRTKKEKTLHNGIKKQKNKKHNRIKRKINELPIEILAEIFDLLPRGNLLAIGKQCKRFHDTVGFIVKKDLLNWKKKLVTVLENLTETIIQSNESFRWELCQKIGYIRVMLLRLNALEAIFGKYINNVETWCILSQPVLKILKEQDAVLNTVLLTHPYFYRDIRQRYFNANMPQLTNFFTKYFTEIQPFLSKIYHIPYGIQLFNLLYSCPSSNLRILVFHPLHTDLSLISMFFEIRGLGKKFEIQDFDYYKDNNVSIDDKLIKLKLYLHNVIENENSDYLYFQIQHILNLETHMEIMRDISFHNEVLESLSNAYDTFLHKTYNDINEKRTQFILEDMKFYCHEITREQEIKTCVSNVICNLKFYCSREYLPGVLMLKDDIDEGNYVYENKDKKILYEYEEPNSQITSELKSVLQCLNVNGKINNTGSALNLNIFITHLDNDKSILISAKKLHFTTVANEEPVKILLDDMLNRFDSTACECHLNGIRCCSDEIL